MVYPALLPLMRTPRLPAVDWTDAPANLNGLVPFAERRNLVSVRVPSHFKRSLRQFKICTSEPPVRNYRNCRLHMFRSEFEITYHNTTWGSTVFNHLTPNDLFSGRTAPLTSRCCIILFIQQIYVLNILNMLHTLCFFLFKMPFIS